MGAIEASGPRKQYPGGVLAVDGMDLDVPGIHMLTTLVRPTTGTASV